MGQNMTHNFDGVNMSVSEQLIFAINTKNTEKVSDLVEKMDVRDINERRYGATALQFACLYFNHEAVDILLAKSGIDINVKGPGGLTPLHTACSYNNHHAVKKLLTRTDVEVNVRTSRGNTPIMVSAMWCQEETLKLMLDEPRVTLETEDDRSLEELVGSRGSKESRKKKCLMMIEERTKRDSRQAKQKTSQDGNIVGWAEKKEEERAIQTHVENKEEKDNDVLSLIWSSFKSRRDGHMYKSGACTTAYCSRECLVNDFCSRECLENDFPGFMR